jgi:DNA-binding NarL/FixJ family response regulator
MITVLLVDDDPLVVSSLKIIIEADADLKVAATGRHGLDAIRLNEELAPDIILMDIRMPVLSGLEAGEEILRRHPGTRLLLLTTFADDEYIIKALRIGARGYILKQHFESIVPSLKAIFAGQSVYGDNIMTRIPALLSGQQQPDFNQYDIREKEIEIIRLVAEGLNNREIAARLFISEGTVRNSLTVILDKLGLRDRTQLAIMYLKGEG